MIQPILSLFTKPLVTLFAISILATLGVIKVFTQKGWLDNPKNNKRLITIPILIPYLGEEVFLSFREY